MNSTDCYPVDDNMTKVFLPVMYGIIFAVGLLGNLTSIIIYVVRLRPWKINSVIMVNLALADLQYVLSLPFLVHYYITEDWSFSDAMCRAVRFGFHFNLYCSILFLACLSVCRYVVVVHPLRAVQMQRKRWAVVVCLAVWLIALLEVTPMVFMLTVEKTANNITSCIDFASNDPQDVWVYSWLLTVVGYLLPLVVVCLSYIQAARELSTGPLEGRISRVRARKLSVLILVVFVLCFTPYHILRALRVYTQIEIPHPLPCVMRRGVYVAYTISRPLAGLNTFFNLALYTLAGDKFHRELLNLLRWRPKFLKFFRTKKFLMVEVVSQPGSGISLTNLMKI
ncbi:2-oxoglutarate receptor 1 [Esox lucius]|uniref:2-oxoglutarate receptor 1 n=1 Tax=Esox lucius TaxID=8010 RepID=UPI00097321F5|nr:2-oxoglutarate receptor 1 [Esox lucius]